MFRNVRQFNYVDVAMDRNAEWSGWRMKDMEHFDPGEGYTVTHDALEHFTKNETTLEQEMMAFGSMIFGRVMGGWWGQHNPLNAGREGNVIMRDIARFLFERDWKIAPRKHCRIHEDVQDFVESRDDFMHEVLGNDYNDATGYRGRAFSPMMPIFRPCAGFLWAIVRHCVAGLGISPIKCANCSTISRKPSSASNGLSMAICSPSNGLTRLWLSRSSIHQPMICQKISGDLLTPWEYSITMLPYQPTR